MARSTFLRSFLSILALGAATPALAAPEVVASIKPLHALVAGVMEGVATPGLIVPGAASEHGYALRPSDAARIEAADLVFWIGPDLETYLTGVLDTLGGNAVSVEMMDIPGLTLLPLREGGLFEPHVHDDHDHAHDDHEHDDNEHDDDHDHGEEAHAHGDHAHDDHAHDDHAHEDHDDHDHEDHAHDDHDHDNHAGHAHGEYDAHIWLDPQNARLMVAAIAEALIAVDPENADAYDANGQALSQRLLALETEIEARLAPARGKPFFVFHDAYHYFEERFDIEATGSFTVNPEIAPGAARLAEIESVVAGSDAVCLFSEPQFSPAVVNAVASGTGARLGELDPIGAALTEGPELYFALVETLADSLIDCLAD